MVGYVARTGEMRNTYRILVGKPEGLRPHGRCSVDGRIILKWILIKNIEWEDLNYLRFEVFSAVKIFAVFWVVTPHGLVCA
jgi:hypothetical protein